MRGLRRIGAIAAVLVAAAAAWSSLGSFSTASGQEKPISIMRAHEGSYRPDPDAPVFVLVLGTDARRGNPRNGRNDSIHILAIDPKTKSAAFVGIPRDSYVPLARGGYGKINSALGPQTMLRTVERLSGCRFDYYMQVAFRGFVDLVNDFGGIPIDVPYDIRDQFANIDVRAGEQRLSGAQALGYARVRKHARFTPRGDIDRSLNQGALVVAALRKARDEVSRYPGRVLHYLAIMQRRVRTNIPTAEALRLGMLAVQVDPDSVANVVLDGPTGSAGGASVVKLNRKAFETMTDVCADGVLSS